MLRLRLEKLLLLPLLWLERVLLDRLNMHTCVPVMAQIVGVVLVLVVLGVAVANLVPGSKTIDSPFPFRTHS